jgi:hypothetical protein
VSPSQGKGYSVTSDARGQFVIEDVQAGTYSFAFFAAGYMMAEKAGLQTVQIGSTGNAVIVEGQMAPMPGVTGRVVDGDGDPVAKARVSLTPGSHVATDGRGRFELPANPGRWVLSVTPAVDMKAPLPDPDSGRAQVWTRTYYPGVSAQEAASKITLRPGDVLDVQIKMQVVAAHDVRRVLLNPDGSPAAKVGIMLAEDLPPAEGTRTVTDGEGAFEFKSVGDGEWYVGTAREKLRAGTWVHVAGEDLERVKLRLAAPFAVHGRVVAEASDGVPALQAPLVAIVPRAGSGHVESTPLANVLLMQRTKAMQQGMRSFLLNDELAILGEPDGAGNFSLVDVEKGGYRVVALAPAPPYYLDAIRFGEVDVASGEIEMSSAEIPITVVYKANGGMLSGTADGCASGTVLLVPVEPERRWFGFLHSARCDAAGRYRIGEVRPGDYYALPFPGGTAITLDESLYGPGNRITVRAGESTTADLR